MRITTPAIQEFDYRPHPATAVLVAVSWAVVTPFGGLLMVHPPPYSGGIGLSPTQAWWFGLFILVTSPLSGMTTIVLIRAAFFSKRRVAITERSLIVPKPAWRDCSLDEIEIPLDEIAGVRLVESNFTGFRGLWIYRTGRNILLAATNFRSRRVFDAMAKAVMKAVGQEDAPVEVE
jgi:hypothetical protein